MPRGDWTNPAACEHMLDFEAAEFAAEYVMRNDAFIVECQALASRQKARAGDLLGTPEFTEKWGLRFRGSG
jgi:hypothetical protein